MCLQNVTIIEGETIPMQERCNSENWKTDKIEIDIFEIDMIDIFIKFGI